MNTTKINTLLGKIKNFNEIESKYFINDGRYSLWRLLNYIDGSLTNRPLRKQLEFDLETYHKSSKSQAVKESDLAAMILTTVNSIVKYHPEALIELYIKGLGQFRPNSFYSTLYDLCSSAFKGNQTKNQVRRSLLKLIIMNKVKRMEQLIHGGGNDYYSMPSFDSVIESDGSGRRAVYLMSRFLRSEPEPEFRVLSDKELGFLIPSSLQTALPDGAWWIGNSQVPAKEMIDQVKMEYMRVVAELETKISSIVDNHYKTPYDFFHKVGKPLGGYDSDHFSDESGFDKAQDMRTLGNDFYSIKDERAMNAISNWYREQITYRYEP